MYRIESDIREIVERFENCAFQLEEFTHARHLTVAAWYATWFSPEEALGRMRTGLQRFIAYHGKQGYHETITRFWMELIGDFLSEICEGLSAAQKVNRVIERYSNKAVLFEYYTRELVMSDAARREWIAPDRKQLPSADRAGVP
jgi:hypothetical protein